MNLNKKYKLDTDNSDAYFAQYTKDLEELTKRKEALHKKWDANRKLIPGADSMEPAGYHTRFLYRVILNGMRNTVPGNTILDKNFKAVSKETFYQ